MRLKVCTYCKTPPRVFVPLPARWREVKGKQNKMVAAAAVVEVLLRQKGIRLMTMMIKIKHPCPLWKPVHDRSPGRHTPAVQFNLGAMRHNGTAILRSGCQVALKGGRTVVCSLRIG